MRTQTALSPTGPQPGPEEPSWDHPTTFHAESRTPHDDEPARGFLLLLHSDPTCPLRLAPDGLLMPKDYERARADTVCGQCGTEAVAASSFSVVRRLREAERALQRLPTYLPACARGRAGGRATDRYPGGRLLPGDALPQGAVSVHPAVPLLADRGVDLTGAVSEALRAAMVAYDRR